jgi:hypothetical protein
MMSCLGRLVLNPPLSASSRVASPRPLPPQVCWPKGSIAELIFTPMVGGAAGAASGRRPWGSRAPPAAPRGRVVRPSPASLHPRSQVERIEAAGGRVAGGRLVTDLVPRDGGGGIREVVARNVTTGEVEVFPADAVVSAVGVTGAPSAPPSPDLPTCKPLPQAPRNPPHPHPHPHPNPNPNHQASRSSCPGSPPSRPAPSCAPP